MSGTLFALVSALVLWMTLCGLCGFFRRYGRFFAVLVLGWGLNTLWMVLGLGAHPLEVNALVAQTALTTYGLVAFGLGWLVGRLRRRFQDSAVDEDTDRAGDRADPH